MENSNNDQGERARRIQIFIWTIPFALLLAWRLQPVIALVAFIAANLVLDRLICLSGESIGGLFYGNGGRHRSADDLCQGDIQRVKFFRRNKRYNEAIEILDQILSRCKDYPEALYLKADILWEGFADKQQAIVCLDNILKQDKPNKIMYDWADNLRHQLMKEKTIALDIYLTNEETMDNEEIKDMGKYLVGN